MKSNNFDRMKKRYNWGGGVFVCFYFEKGSLAQAGPTTPNVVDLNF